MIITKKLAAVILVVVVVIGIIFTWTGLKAPAPELNKENKASTAIESPVKEAKAESSSFFAEYRMERERTRSKQIELLREIMNRADLGNIGESASKQLISISEDIEKEMKAENLVKSKGYKECVVIILPRMTTVVLQSQPLNAKQEKEVKEVVAGITGYNEKQIDLIVRG